MLFLCIRTLAFLLAIFFQIVTAKKILSIGAKSSLNINQFLFVAT